MSIPEPQSCSTERGVQGSADREPAAASKPSSGASDLKPRLVLWVGFPTSWATGLDDDREDPPNGDATPTSPKMPIDRERDGVVLRSGLPAGDPDGRPLTWVAVGFSKPEKPKAGPASSMAKSDGREG